MKINKVNLAQKFDLIEGYWSPRLAGEVNDFAVKLAKLKGEFVWHHHETEDELFLVVSGRLVLRVRDQDDIVLEAGEFAIIPHGVEHMPVADDEVHVLLFERTGTVNTGNVSDDRTIAQIDRV